MSKLVDNINIAIKNKRTTTPFADYSVSMETVPELLKPKYLQQVAFEAVLGTRHYISEELTYGNIDVLKEVLHEVKRSIVEEVFGEFRMPLRELRHSIYNREMEKSLEILSKIESQMFNV